MTYSPAHYAQYDPSFVDDLRASQAYVWKAAKILSELGMHVAVPPLVIRPDESEMADYADAGDLNIIQRAEVKHRMIQFTGRHDYPFQTVIVDVCHAWDKANPKPYLYLIFNRDASSYLVIHGNTSRHWRRVQRNDKGKNRVREFYECPIEYCHFAGSTK